MSKFDRWYTQSSVINISEADKDELLDKDDVVVYRGNLPVGAKTDDDTGLQDVHSFFEEAGPDYTGLYYHFNIKFPMSRFFASGSKNLPDFSSNPNGLFTLDDFDLSLKNPSFFKDYKDFCKSEFVDYIKQQNENVGNYLEGNAKNGITTPISDSWFYEDGSDLLNCIFGDPKEPQTAEEDSTKGAFSIFAMTNNFYAPPNPKKVNIIHAQGVLLVGLDESDALNFLIKGYPEGGSLTKQVRREPTSTSNTARVYDKLDSVDKKNQPKVYNDGTVTPKTVNEIEQQRNPKDEIRQMVHDKVKTKLETFTDSGFLNMETVEDVYDNVLNVMPLDDIMNIAVDCCKRYIPDADMISKTTDVVLKNLSNEEINKMLSYVNANNDFFSTKFKTEIIDKFQQDTGEILGASTPQIFKQYLLSRIENSDAIRNITSSVLFSSVPAAIVMLATLDYEKAEEMLSSITETNFNQINIDNILSEGLNKISQTTGLPASQALGILNVVKNSKNKIQQSYREITGEEVSPLVAQALIKDLLNMTLGG